MEDAERVARDAFGFERLRPGQGEAIESALAGRDTLAVMSTGSGKSAIYQIAALLIDGPTVVISPLVSLQVDQVDAIEDELPGESAALNASASDRRRRDHLGALAAGELEFLFLAPEQLARPDTLEALAGAGVSLLVVDEAHCISEWGHDFRPDYLRLGGLVDDLGHPTTLALTATASPPIREEIVERLHMRDPHIVVRGFDRPNIWLGVEHHREEHDKRRALLERVKAADPPGIVYAATRKVAEELAREMCGLGLAAAAYHAGFPRKKRDEIQERFMDAGDLDVIVATTAFGMGVDKADVRFVYHHAVSESVDSYYQEIGRGGRDDKPAEAVLFWRPEDLGLRRFFAGGQLDGETLENVVRAVRRRRKPVPAPILAEDLDLSETRLMSALGRLESVAAVEVRGDGSVERGDDGGRSVEDVVEAAAEEEQERHRFDSSRLEMMRSYAEHDHCRRNFILSYFGEAHEGACGNCDNCDAGHGEASPAEGPYALGARVVHDDWGEGVVQRYDGDKLTVLFEAAGYRTLSSDLVEQRNLLEPAD